MSLCLLIMQKDAKDVFKPITGPQNITGQHSRQPTNQPNKQTKLYGYLMLPTFECLTLTFIDTTATKINSTWQIHTLYWCRVINAQADLPVVRATIFIVRPVTELVTVTPCAQDGYGAVVSPIRAAPTTSTCTVRTLQVWIVVPFSYCRQCQQYYNRDHQLSIPHSVNTTPALNGCPVH